MNERLKSARKGKNWSQAKASEEIGVDLKTIQRWERGESIPQPFYREILCKIYGLSLIELGFCFSIESKDSTNQSIGSVKTGNLNSLYSQEEDKDWTSWFGVKLAQILRMVSTLNDPFFSVELQTLVDQEIRMIDETLNQHQASEEQKISRRQALVTIAALPLSLMNIRTWPIDDIASRELLSYCSASLTSCWHLLRGNGLTAVSEIIPQYTPILRTLAQHTSKYQQVAARLAAQSSILQAIIAMHHLNPTNRETHCKDAIRYASIAQDNNLQATALTYLGYTYSFCYFPSHPEKAVQTFLEALKYVGDEAPLLKSNISMGLAEAYAQSKEEQLAFRFIEQAKTNFPTHPELDPSYIYGDCSLHVLFQWEGKMYLDLSGHYPEKGYQRKAGDALLQSISEQSISNRSTAETLIYRADAARSLGNLEEFTATLHQAAQMAIALKSKKRFTEAVSVLQKAPESWQREGQMGSLAKEMFSHPLGKKVN